MSLKKRNIAILLGDPSGIGPELISKLMTQPEINDANIILIGERNVFENGNKITGNSIKLNFVEKFEEIDFEKNNKFFIDISKGNNTNYKISECSKESGISVLNALNYSLDLAKAKKIDAINFGPFNKTSLHLGGCKF